MRKAIFIATALATAALLLAACGKKGAEGPSPDSLKADIAAVTGELNGYLDGHNFSNTEAGALSAELRKLAGKYGELEKQAEELKGRSGDEEYGDLGTLAAEGQAKAEALAGALAAGPPMGDAAKMTALNDAVEEWVDYSDRVGTPAEGETPGTAEPAEPGSADTPGYPGRGKHLGWWKNPDWARDRGTRGADGETPGTGEMERERERKRDGTGGGPEREREREHMGSGPGSGGGTGPGSGGGRGPGSGGGSGSGGGKGRGGK
jgi:hypothetical protein